MRLLCILHYKLHFQTVCHHSRSFKIIEDYFEQIILEDQDVLKDEQNWNKVLNCIPDESPSGS